jgi:hypothetical protein
VVDDEGRWIWERFTRSRLEDWSTSSLLLEWRHIAGDSGSDGVKLRTLNARTVDPDDVGDAVMSRLAGVHRGHATAPDLSADQFVERAIQLLEEGRPEEAADIFAALVVVHPGDGDALNNLGFCLLPTDPTTAAKVLDRASSLPSEKSAINSANRAFAKHLLGDNQGALLLLKIAQDQPNPGPVLMWVENECGQFAVRGLDSIAEYADLLTRHIQQVASASTDPQ